MCQQDNEKRDGRGLDLSNFIAKEGTIQSAEFIWEHGKFYFLLQFENTSVRFPEFRIPVTGEKALPGLVGTIYEITGCTSEYQLAGKRVMTYYNLVEGVYSFGPL